MIPPGAGEVTVRDIAVSEYHYPFTGGAAFSSSDPELDRLYQAGIRTTQMNSFDAFTDCPTREQRAWVGDGVVHQMVHFVANEDWRLARNYVALGASPRADGMLPMTVAGEIEYRGGYTIPDWALHWIHAVWNLFRYDGDRPATLRLLPVVERVLRWYEPYIDKHGTLSDLPEWNLIDWSSVFSSGRSSLITGLWARGLAEYAEMADWLGNTASAAWARGLWEQARGGYGDFWDHARGSYVDHIVDGERQPAMSQAAGAVAIVSGLAPQDQWAGIVDVITDPSRLVVRSWIGGEDGGSTCSASPRPSRDTARSKLLRDLAPSSAWPARCPPRTDSSRWRSRTVRSAWTAQSRCGLSHRAAKDPLRRPDTVSSPCDQPCALAACPAVGWCRGGCRCLQLRSSAGPALYPERSWACPRCCGFSGRAGSTGCR
jgi:hypothetical protein